MNNDRVQYSGGGIGFGGVLFIVFLVLKLTGHITWSWWWVFSPLWIPFAIVIFILFMALVFMAFAWVIEKMTS